MKFMKIGINWSEDILWYLYVICLNVFMRLVRLNEVVISINKIVKNFV